MSTGASASAQPAHGPPEEEDLRRQGTEDDEEDQGSAEPNTPLATGDERHGRGYFRHGRPESDASSKKSGRSAWRKGERKKKE